MMGTLRLQFKPKGHCRLIHWGFEGGEDCPVDQCIWETLSKQKAPLDADELVGKDVHKLLPNALRDGSLPLWSRMWKVTC